MKLDISRIVAGGAAVCLATWLALAVAAGDVGLQRSISKGGITLFELPSVVLLVASVAIAVAFVAAKRLHLTPAQLVVAVLVGDVLAGIALAPLAVGELKPIHAPLVVFSVSVMGLQPAATFVGAWVGTQLQASSPRPRRRRS